MNNTTVRYLRRHAIPVLIPALLIAACATDPYDSSDGLQAVQYDCQGVPLKVEYGVKIVRLTWPDGRDVLRLTTSESDAPLIRYESAHSDLRIERDILWGREGGNPRSCIERGA